MNREDLQKMIGTQDLNVSQAMQKIDQNVKGILYIVDTDGRLKGSLTDGDIRRWIIKTGNLNGTAGQMMCRDAHYIFESEKNQCRKIMKQYKIHSVPILNIDHVIVDVFFYDECCGFSKQMSTDVLADIPVIIMAGGKGTRLYPYTKILPKPLIPIGEVPILERIIYQFGRYGAKKFYITVNYKREIIKAYFYEQQMPYELVFVEEDIPLGTAGSIRCIKEEFHTPVIVANCDSLINADYGNILLHHKDSGNGLTIVSSLKNTRIPYGVLHSQKQGRITEMEEKPAFSYFINTGMYLIEPEHMKKIPKGSVYHMTQLAEELIKSTVPVGMYPVSEDSFLDMGEFAEMKKMEERICGAGVFC